mmetsp:Transcript_131937/g.329064  ORF Transcript_131937/g.329064 Transcript_131937/m.329064 type:complete len:593 (-) Transcript_131937:171-1949(-)
MADSSFFSSLGSASALLQVQLGLGLVLGAVGIAVSSSPDLRKHMDGATWESTLRAAAKAASPALLLTVFALIQAHAASPDILTSAGLLVSGAAVTLSAFIAVLGPIRGSSAPEEDGPAPFVTASRVLSSIQAFGQFVLIFGTLPSGSQLLCASLFVRLALTVQTVRAVSRALLLGASPVSKALRDMEPVLTLAPFLGGLALLDAMSWGPSGIMLTLLQPVVYCTLLVVMIAFVRLSLGAGIDSFGGPDLAFTFQLEGAVGSTVEAARAAIVFAIYAAMIFSLGRVLHGTFAVEMSMSGFSVQWGDPLASAAAKMSLLAIVTHFADFALGVLGSEEEHAQAANGALPINGVEVSGASAPAHLRDLTVTDYAKAVVTPAHTLLLGLVAARMSLPDPDKSGALNVAAMPFSYGFVLASMGVMMQVVLLIFFGIAHADESHASQPCFDTTGTVQWSVKSQVLGKIVEGFRLATVFLLEGGLLLGCIGLGPVPLAVGGFSTASALYLLSPAEARETGLMVVKVCTRSLGSSIETILEKQRQAQEAAAARKAAAVAKALEAESAPKHKTQAEKGSGGSGGPKQGAPAGAKKDGPKRKK